MGKKKHEDDKGAYKEIPLSAPNWFANNPIWSFQAFAEHIHNQARQVLVKDGFHAEMLFFLGLDGKGSIVLPHDNDRDRVAKYARDRIERDYAYGVIHISECWMRWADGPNDHILNQVIAGEIRVSELNPEHRKEVLTVCAQSRDGYSMNWIDEIVRDEKKVVKGFGEARKFGGTEGLEGRFGKLFG